MVERSRYEERGGRGGRDEGRGGREPERGGRDEPRGGYDRGGRDEPRGGRDDDRGGRGTERGGSRGGSGFHYQARSREAVEKRANMGANDFDKILKDGVKMWTPADKDNRIRILPPTWAKPEHYGYDIHVHYGVGPDRASYLDLFKMRGEPDPITEEMQELRRSGDATDDEIKQMDSKRRVLVWLIDRDDEGEGVQAWAMPWTIDRDISNVSIDKQTGGVLNIDDPEEGYDVEFRKDGKGIGTKYTAVSISRRSSRLGKDAWLQYAIDNPLPDQLQFFSYDDIAKEFGGGGPHRERDRGRPEGRGDARGDRGGARHETPEEMTWEQIHGMTGTELDALVAQDDRLKNIDPNKAGTDAELAGWICEDLGIRKPAEGRPRGRVEAPDAGAGARMADMRARRGGRGDMPHPDDVPY